MQKLVLLSIHLQFYTFMKLLFNHKSLYGWCWCDLDVFCWELLVSPSNWYCKTVNSWQKTQKLVFLSIHLQFYTFMNLLFNHKTLFDWCWCDLDVFCWELLVSPSNWHYKPVNLWQKNIKIWFLNHKFKHLLSYCLIIKFNMILITYILKPENI